MSGVYAYSKGSYHWETLDLEYRINPRSRGGIAREIVHGDKGGEGKSHDDDSYHHPHVCRRNQSPFFSPLPSDFAFFFSTLFLSLF